MSYLLIQSDASAQVVPCAGIPVENLPGTAIDLINEMKESFTSMSRYVGVVDYRKVPKLMKQLDRMRDVLRKQANHVYAEQLEDIMTDSCVSCDYVPDLIVNCRRKNCLAHLKESELYLNVILTSVKHAKNLEVVRMDLVVAGLQSLCEGLKQFIADKVNKGYL